MSKTITISDEQFEAIKDQICEEGKCKKEEKKVGFEIKSLSGNILFQSSKTTYKEAVKEALESDADLSGANLSDADLSGADLHDADLSDADLHDANLSDADLSGADLHDADLSDANLSDANLYGANLSGADLRGANLSGAELNCAKFYGKCGDVKLKKDQVPVFLAALGFVIEE